MNLIDLDNQQLDNFIKNQPRSQFLQSWAWGEFNANLGRKVWRFGIKADNQLIAVVSFFKKKLPGGRAYFYSPRGPLFDFELKPETIQEALNLFTDKIKTLARRQRVIFWRLEPVKILADRHIIQTIDVQPHQTLMVDLQKSADEILVDMHQKTRYNIRLAEKKGVVVKHSRPSPEQLAKWWQLLSTTTTRDRFSSHERSYYEKILALPFSEIWQAEYKGEILAMAIIISFGDMATYVHGASASIDRHIMAPYLLHWQAINWAKKLGLRYYDFYGIDEHRWPGVTRFKQGFGGQIIKYSGTFDLVFKPVYYRVYKLFRKLRRLI